jgi:hypothetical protein
VNTSDTDLKLPKIMANLIFEDIAVELEDLQFHSVLKLLDSVSSYDKVKEVIA